MLLSLSLAGVITFRAIEEDDVMSHALSEHSLLLPDTLLDDCILLACFVLVGECVRAFTIPQCLRYPFFAEMIAPRMSKIVRVSVM